MINKTKTSIFLLFFVSALFSLALLFPDLSPAAEDPERPKIGLALGGGGAKGAAHIGVLKVLEELKIPIDYIAGTSMGAIVGSLYASGMSSAEIEEVLTTVDWDDIFSDDPSRKDIDFRRKQEDLTFLSKITVGIKNGKVQFPKGVISGQKIDVFFETLMMPVADIENFDQLPIPFRAIATDIETGDMVVIGSGSLAEAARASMSVPGVFPPIDVEGRYLIDGGIVRNLPVDIVREMGADVVIAVDVGKPLLKREELNSPLTIMNQMVDIMIKQNVQAQIDSLTKKDVFIRPDLGTISSSDFKRGKEAAERGEHAARQEEKNLRLYAVSDEEYAVFLARHKQEQVSSITVGSVTVEGLSVVSPEAVASKVKIEEGERLDMETLRKDVGLVYGMGDFERVDINIKPRSDAYDIMLRMTEKSWGPNYLRLGVNLETDFEGDSEFNALADFTMRWINRLGAEWKNQVQIGTTKRIFSEFYQPLVASRFFFIAPHIELRQEPVNVYTGNDLIAEYRLRTLEGGIDLGIQPWTYGELRIGYIRGIIKPRLRTGTLDLNEESKSRGGLRARLIADQVDSVNFPHEGFYGQVLFYSSLDSLGADDNYNKFEISFLEAFTYKKYTILGQVKFGSYIGNEIPYYDEFTLGGFLSLSGLHQDQLRGQRMGLGKIIAYWNARKSLLGDFYLGGSLETGNVWTRDEDIDFASLRLAGSVFIGYDSFFGPVYLAFGHADGGNNALYLYLGRTF